MLKKYLKSLLYISLLTVSIYIYIDFSYEKLNLKENDSDILVNVLIDGNENEYKLDFGSTFNDLINEINNDSIDYSSINKNYILANNETIELRKDNNSELISINDNDINNLIKLPGIGIKTANKIIEYRNIYGDFNRIEELKNVSGIGDKKYEKIKDLITI